MNRSHTARLRALEERAEQGGDDYALFGWTESADGRVASYHVHGDGRTYSPEAFDRLIDDHPDTVFVPLQAPSALSEAAAKAYWEEAESNQPTWEDLLAENAEADSLREAGAGSAAGSDAETDEPGALPQAPADEGEATPEDAEGEDADVDEDAWVAGVTLDSDRATLARYHRRLMARAEPFWEEMRARKARLDGRARM